MECGRGDCRTDEDGRVTFPIVEGTYDITAGGVNAVARQLTAQALGAQTPLVTIELDRGVSVSGRLVWPDDTPAVLDGHVSAATEPRATANVEKGVFVLRNVMPGPLTLSVETGAPSYVRSEPVEITAPATDVKHVVPRLGRIEGRVVVRDAEEPLREFTVTVQPQDRRSSPGPEPQSFRDTDGEFVIDGIGPGRYDVVAKATGYTAGEAKVTVEEGETASASLEITRAGSVAGRVTSGGRPVPEAFVRPGFRGEWRGETAAAQADDKGHYTIEGVPPGSHELSISAPGFVEASVKVEVIAGKESRADVELSRGRELRGRVIDASGRPIANAEVNAEGIWSNARTDTGGSFTLTGLNDGKLTITATKDGYLDGRAIVEPGPPRDVTIVLGRGATVAGRVRGLSPQELTAVEVRAVSVSAPRQTEPARVDASGAFTISGVEDGEVMVLAHLKGTPPRMIQTTIRVQQAIAPPVELDFSGGIPVRGRVTARGRPVQGQVAFFAKTQSQTPVAITESAGDGSYAVQLPTPGEYRVLVFHSRSGAFNGRLTVAGKMVHDIEIGGGRVSGRVVDAVTRAPVAGALVRLTAVEVRTGPDGRFSLDDVPDGAQKLVASATGYAPELHSFKAANGMASELEIALTRGTPVQVRFVDAGGGQPLEGFAMIGDAAGMLIIVGGAVPADGLGLQLQLSAGTYELHAIAEGYARKSATLTVPGPPLTLALERAP